MKTKKLIKTGLGLAAGLFIGNAAIWPMISGGDFERGLIVGGLAACLALVVYSIWAVCRSGKLCDTENRKS